MQTHPCYNCKKDSSGGGSIVYGGMFFKMCPECLEDEEVIREINEFWRKLEEEQSKTATDELNEKTHELDSG
jgi:hypothetical protein